MDTSEIEPEDESGDCHTPEETLQCKEQSRISKRKCEVVFSTREVKADGTTEITETQENIDVEIYMPSSPSTDADADFEIDLSDEESSINLLCDICGRNFQTKRKLSQHRHVHSNKMLECKECKYKTTYRSTMTRHMNMHKYHRGELKKEFVCKECGNDFISAQNLKVHMLLHAEKKPYKCHTCGEEYTQKNNLRLHSLKHKQKRTLVINKSGHVHVTPAFKASGQSSKSNKKYSCKFCDKTFNFNHDVKRHIKTVHEKVTGYYCSECKLGLVDVTALKQHICSKHLKLRNYRCLHCYRSYTKKYSLKAHIINHHKLNTDLEEIEKNNCETEPLFDQELIDSFRVKSAEQSDTNTASV